MAMNESESKYGIAIFKDLMVSMRDGGSAGDRHLSTDP